MRRRTARALPAAALLAFAAAALWVWFQRYDPDPARYPVRGIDVSHHQNAIDWPRVAADDVAFAYLKATEGGDYRDARFAENWRAARAAGLAVGAYHYFTFCRSGIEQAENFLAVAPVAADALPPAVDLEFGGNCGQVPAGPALRKELEDFLGRVESAYGKQAVFYVTPEFLAFYRGQVPTRALWRRSLLRRPDNRAPWRLWQYHNRGHVDGVVGPVDLDVYSGSAADFERWRGVR